MGTAGVLCRECRHDSAYWTSYHCPECGVLSESLYRKEHKDPERGRQMTRAEIDAEIAAAVRAGFYALPVVAS